MTFFFAALLFGAGFLSGAVNAIAGGGTFLIFGMLTLAGVPPISANATSAIAQFPGYITSSHAYRADIRAMGRSAIILCVLSSIGTLAGALVLISLDNASFSAIVPWLLLAATGIFAAGPWLRPTRIHAQTREDSPSLAGGITQLVTSVYGGFFGAGMGVMMLATLSLTEGGDYHRINALKCLLSIVIAAVAIVVFASGGVVAWLHAALLVPGAALGGYAGVWIARRVPQGIVRGFVILVGVLLAGYYFWRG